MLNKNLLILLGATALSTACKQEPAPEYAIVEGNISNFNGKELAVYGEAGAFNASLTIDENGMFLDTLKLNNGAYTFTDGRNRLRIYLEQGDNVKINYDANNVGETLNFEGSAGNSALYYEEKKKAEEELSADKGNIYLMEEADFLIHTGDVKQKHLALLEEKADLPESFKALEQQHINYEYLSKLNRYEAYHRHYAKKPEFEASDAVKGPLSAIETTDEVLFKFAPAYKTLLNNRYQQAASEISEESEVPFEIAYLEQVGANTSDLIRNTLLNEAAGVYFSYTKDPEKYYNTFMSVSTNEVHKVAIKADYEKLMSLAAGNPSPSFENYENHAGGTTSLADLQGKYLYVDVWATWCGPCLREIPSLKTLESEYHGKNIEFVSISIDTEQAYTKWKEMVVEKELKGVQLLADNAWESQFVQDYMIKGIPRFILIAPDGSIVDSNAPRPSSDEIRTVLEGLEL